jgi:hypothetical protein
MARADQIYVMRHFGAMQGLYEHHGIDTGDGNVIHYRKPEGRDAIISVTPKDSFAQGGRIYVKRYDTCLIAEDVLERAHSRLGETRYDLWTNNCEHFATWCKIGRSESPQLARIGFGNQGFTLPELRTLMDETSHETSHAQAIALFQRALANTLATQQQLQGQYDQALHDQVTWHRVAQLALQQEKEIVARAALERKVQAKRQAETLKTQIAEAIALQQDIERRLQTLPPPNP